MGPVVLLFAAFLLHLCETQGTSTGTPVFVQTGKDLVLDVKEPVVLEEGNDFIWKLNGSNNIVRYDGDKTKTAKIYENRAEFSVQNFSLLLKNVQKNDSGDYGAYVVADKDHLKAKYKVTVQDPVSAVEMTVNHVSRSSDSCTLTVTCSTQDSHINSTVRCYNQTCSQERGEQSVVTTSGASLRVYLVNDSIICNHSNRVSRDEKIEMAEPICTQLAASREVNNSVDILVPILIIIIIIIIIVAVFCLLRRRRKRKSENIEHTVDLDRDVRQSDATARPQEQSLTNDASSSSSPSIYCLVGPHTGSMGATTTKANTPTPESLYAQVEKRS